MLLSDDNFLLYAIKHYYPVHYSTEEFTSDLRRVTYVKRLLTKYRLTDVLLERLILNHLILLFNVFEPTNSVNSMLFFRVRQEDYSALKTFLVYLNRMSDTINFNNKTLYSSDIPIDMFIAHKLRVL